MSTLYNDIICSLNVADLQIPFCNNYPWKEDSMHWDTAEEDAVQKSIVL